MADPNKKNLPDLLIKPPIRKLNILINWTFLIWSICQVCVLVVAEFRDIWVTGENLKYIDYYVLSIQRKFWKTFLVSERESEIECVFVWESCWRGSATQRPPATTQVAEKDQHPPGQGRKNLFNRYSIPEYPVY